MDKYDYPEARTLIHRICQEAKEGQFKTRALFMAVLEENPQLAAQGYNVFGSIFFWNEASCHLYGYSKNEVIGKDLFNLVMPAEMRQLAHDLIVVAGKTGKTIEPGACDLMHSSGEYFTVYSGHLMFNWEDTPEFYCIDLALNTEAEGSAVTAP